jgi:transposase
MLANLEDRYRNVEFIALLKQRDKCHPDEAIIRVVLDNHSAYISKDDHAYLVERPGRFELVHTSKHGSWLNLIQCAFSKMAGTFLRQVQVNKEELKQRILKGIAEINVAPLVFRGNQFDLGVALAMPGLLKCTTSEKNEHPSE